MGKWALLLLPDIPVKIHVNHIGPLEIRLRRNRSLWIRDPLTHERFQLAAFRSFVPANSVIYDVGANIGLYTRFFAACFDAAQVVAFEPVPDNRRQLEKNVDLGKIGHRVTILPFALADADGEQEFRVDDMSSASSTLSRVTGGCAAQGREQYGFSPKVRLVACRRLDSIIADLKLPAPDVIKVDVEGAEDLLLLGATDCLRSQSPKLAIELHGADKAKAVFAILSDLHYRCAAKVSHRLDCSGYCLLNDSIVDAARDFYDIHFLLASKKPDDLPAAVRVFEG